MNLTQRRVKGHHMVYIMQWFKILVRINKCHIDVVLLQISFLR